MCVKLCEKLPSLVDILLLHTDMNFAYMRYLTLIELPPIMEIDC